MVIHFRSALRAIPDAIHHAFSLSLSTISFRSIAPQSGLKDLSVTPFDGPTIIVKTASTYLYVLQGTHIVVRLKY